MDKTAYNGGKARQDIFVTNLAGTPAESIKVMGAIQTYPNTATGEEAMKPYRGTIWLWAEPSNSTGHYRNEEQFAVFDGTLEKQQTVGGVSKSIIELPLTAAEQTSVGADAKKAQELQELLFKETLKAFRNALDDATTDNESDTYLTGNEGKVLTNIYWGPATNGFNVVFRKIDGDGNALNGATFTLYKANASGTEIAKDGSGNPLAYQTSGVDVTATSENIAAANAVTIKEKQTSTANGTTTETAVSRDVYGDGLVVFEKIPPGAYFMKETTAPTATVGGKTVTYAPVEEIYKVVLDSKGWYTIYAPGRDDSGNPVWTAAAPAPTTKFVKGTDEKYAMPTGTIAQDANTVDIYTVMNVDARTGRVILKKVGENNVPLGDATTSSNQAKFTVYYADMNTVVQVDGKNSSGNAIKVPLKDLLSGASGVFFIGDLPYGTYYLEETQAPSGYSTPGNLFEFKVDANGVSKMVSATWTPTNTLSANGPAVPQG